MYQSTPETPPYSLTERELGELRIMKQAFAKSLIEAGAVKECTPEAEKIVLDWVSFACRNIEPDWKAYKTNDPTVNPEAQPF